MSRSVPYVSFRIGSRTLLAWPPGLSREARLCYLGSTHPNTPRKRWAVRLLRAAVTLGVDHLIMKSVCIDDRCLEMLSDGMLRILAARHGLSSPRYVLGFPAQPDRGRCYATMIDQDGSPRAFVKVATTPAAAKTLERELRALTWLSASPFPFDYPRVEGFAGTAEGALLAMGVIPRGASPAGEQAMETLLAGWYEARPEGTVVTGEDVRAMGWWQDFQHAGVMTAAFHQDLNAALARPVVVGVAHGDFGPGNVRVAGSRSFLFDWEGFDMAAPELTDACHLWMACHHRWALAEPLSAVRELARTLGSRYRGFRLSLPLCLAFLASRESLAARRMIDAWPGIGALRDDT